MNTKRIKYYTLGNIDTLPQYELLSPRLKKNLHVVGHVLPFRVNSYVVDHLINWENAENDPVFQLTFLHKEMLSDEQFQLMSNTLAKENVRTREIEAAARKIRYDMNPHPAGQLTANVPNTRDGPLPGVQHKYRETVLVFPSQGQTCHSYCTFCFRWPQFVGMNDLKFATDQSNRFFRYLRKNKQITDVLFTGGDPMVMSAKLLAKYIEPLLEDDFNHIRNIRIGSKSLSYWPYRYVTDPDADQVLGLFKTVADAGKHLSFMAHVNHPNELKPYIAKEAVRRIRQTGAVIRTQSPLIRHINDCPEVWAEMWNKQVGLGMIPYYMFVERNTGAQHYFSIPLHKALKIFQGAIRQVSGLAKTARGPSMSANPGKVCVEGVAEVAGEKVFILSMLQGRNPNWVKQPFFAKYDEKATWLNDLEPALGMKKFPFEN